MYRFAILGGLALLLASCSSIPNLNSRPVAMIDWVDFIQLNGITYLASHSSLGRSLERADLGPEFATVQFKVADNVSAPDYQTKDGDAAFLERGTSIFAVQGYAPQFRLAANRDGQIVLYEADTNPSARLGGELLDLRDKVERIVIVSAEDGTTELAAIDDAQEVARLVELVLAAPIDQNRQMPDDPGQSYFLAFHFKDGTATSRMYWLGSGELSRGIFLPPEFGTAITAVYQPIDTLGTTPQPD